MIKRLARLLRLVRASFDILMSLGPLALIEQFDLWSRKERYRRRNAQAMIMTTDVPRSSTSIKRKLQRVVYIAGTSELMSRRYRITNICEQLEKQNIEYQVVLDIDVYQRFRELLTADVIVFQRVQATREMLELASVAQKQGISVAFEIDDFLFEHSVLTTNPSFHEMPSSERQLFHQLIAGYREMLLHCDNFIGSTEFLANEATKLGRLSFVIRNGLSDQYVNMAGLALQRKRPPTKQQAHNIRIGYLSGTRTHRHDFDIIVKPLLHLLVQYPEIHLVICGYLDLPSTFAPFTARIERHPFMHWERLIRITASLDINIAPLNITSDFNRGKSALKYFEAAIVQVPTVASPIEDFEVAIGHGENGLLASNETDWFDCLQSLIEVPEFRLKLGQQAYQDALDRYTSIAQSVHTRKIFELLGR